MQFYQQNRSRTWKNVAEKDTLRLSQLANREVKNGKFCKFAVSFNVLMLK